MVQDGRPFTKANTAASEAAFVSARPIWIEGQEDQRNIFAGFRAIVTEEVTDGAVLRLTGATISRIFVNGEFLGYGPARGPHGFYRVDEWALAGRCGPGTNVFAVEVADEHKVLASTAGRGVLFEAAILDHRVRKV